MKERPIIFSGEMVRAILDGRKTQTRRVLIKSTEFKGPYNPEYIEFYKDSAWDTICPYGKIGDRLWVRETYTFGARPFYKATDAGDGSAKVRWISSRYMPRVVSRITLEITAIRLERVQEITDADALKEGVGPIDPNWIGTNYKGKWRNRFSDLWDRLNAKRGFGWSKNPWVWVIEFRRVGP